MADSSIPPTDTLDPQFVADLAAVRIKGAGRDRFLARLGAALMPLGVALGAVAWFIARSTDNALNQRDAIILAIIGMTVSVCGAALFLRYSFAEFLRFWMARLLLQQAAADASNTPAGAPTLRKESVS